MKVGHKSNQSHQHNRKLNQKETNLSVQTKRIPLFNILWYTLDDLLQLRYWKAIAISA